MLEREQAAIKEDTEKVLHLLSSNAASLTPTSPSLPPRYMIKEITVMDLPTRDV